MTDWIQVAIEATQPKSPVPCESHTKALELACRFHNRCCELEEIIEMFCADAEAMKDQHHEKA